MVNASYDVTCNTIHTDAIWYFFLFDNFVWLSKCRGNVVTMQTKFEETIVKRMGNLTTKRQCTSKKFSYHWMGIICDILQELLRKLYQTWWRLKNKSIITWLNFNNTKRIIRNMGTAFYFTLGFMCVPELNVIPYMKLIIVYTSIYFSRSRRMWLTSSSHFVLW